MPQVEANDTHGPCVVVTYSPTVGSIRVTLPMENGDDGDGDAFVDVDASHDQVRSHLFAQERPCSSMLGF